MVVLDQISVVAEKNSADLHVTSFATVAFTLLYSCVIATFEKCLRPCNSYWRSNLASTFLNPSFSTVYMGSISFAIMFVTESVDSFHLALCREYFVDRAKASMIADVDVFAPALLSRGFTSRAYNVCCRVMLAKMGSPVGRISVLHHQLFSATAAYRFVFIFRRSIFIRFKTKVDPHSRGCFFSLTQGMVASEDTSEREQTIWGRPAISFANYFAQTHTSCLILVQKSLFIMTMTTYVHLTQFPYFQRKPEKRWN